MEDDEAFVEKSSAKKPSTPNQQKPRLKKPPSGSNKPPTRKQMAQMAEASALGGGASLGDTFLTDMLMPGGASKKGAKKGKATFSTATKPNFRAGSAGNRMSPTKK